MAAQHPQPVTIDADATAHLVEYCKAHGHDRLLLVMDTNTRAALGARVEAALQAAELDVVTVVFGDGEVVADAEHVFTVLLAADHAPRTCVAVTVSLVLASPMAASVLICSAPS